VAGTFDDCQRLTKEAFADAALAERHRLTSANSINLGRLLPQMVYYVHAAARLTAHGFDLRDPHQAPLLVVPSGNFGNLTAGLLAYRMGLPCHRFVAATNANDVVPEYLTTGRYRPRPSRSTLANAMDVGDPSNWARIRALAGDDLATIRLWMWSESITDEEIRRTIAEVHRQTGQVLDPHTAVGWLALERYRHEEPRGEAGEAAGRPAVILATAHPAKFAEVVEPVLGEKLPLPEALAACLDRPLLAEPIAAELGALKEKLESGQGPRLSGNRTPQ
jgi:threonine synthase